MRAAFAPSVLFLVSSLVASGGRCAVLPRDDDATDTGSTANITTAVSNGTVSASIGGSVNATLDGSNTTTCYSGVRLFVARGTLEVQGESAQEVYVSKILETIPDSYSTEIVYPAAPFWLPLEFISSVLTGISDAQTQIYEYHAACPDSLMVIMGYSQGARVMGHVMGGSSLFQNDTAEPISFPMQPICSSAASKVVLFGDPGRKLDLGDDADIGNLCNGSAFYPREGTQLIAFEQFGYRLQEWCNFGDPVCCATGTNLDAHVSYFTPEFAANNTQVVADFVAEKFGGMSTSPSTLLGNVQEDIFPFNVTACDAFPWDPLFNRDLEADSEKAARLGAMFGL